MSPSHRSTSPAVYAVLSAPAGAFFGFLNVALGYRATAAGLSVTSTAGLVALGVAPHVLKPLWAPLVDLTLSRKKWYIIGSIACAGGIFALGAVPLRPNTQALLSVTVLLASLAASFSMIGLDGLMAYATPDEQKGRAGGWFQAGLLGGTGVGGGLGLYLSQHLPSSWLASGTVAIIALFCSLGISQVPETISERSRYGLAKTLQGVVMDLWAVLRSRRGVIALALCLAPIGTGAAAGLWGAVANDWGASAAVVALVTGGLGGILTGIGCVVGGLLADRIGRFTGYTASCALLAMLALTMAAVPHSVAAYVLFTLMYAFVSGMGFAAFTGFVLEAIGTGAAATKYNFFAAASNLPVYYMTRIDGLAHDWWGAAGMLYTEAALGIVGVAFGTAVMISLRPRTPRAVLA